MEHQIIICAENETTGTQKFFAFTKSKTGQLDYAGAISKPDNIDNGTWQTIQASSYFTPSYYTYLDAAMDKTITLFVAADVDISDADTFAFLTHVGALICAVEAKDSLLAGKLYLRRKSLFDKFSHLTQFILEPLCVEILFSICFGQMDEADENQVPLIFNSAKKKLGFKTQEESLQQSFVRYFKENQVAVTMEVVGTCFHHWNPTPESLETMLTHISWSDFDKHCATIRKIRQNFYESLKVSVQAEPYNSHDPNAILVSIEDTQSKICGYTGLAKAGYIRRTGAEIIRTAKETKVNYNASLASISRNNIVVRMTI